MGSEEEIEFFGFAPVTLVSELQGEIEGILKEGIEKLSFLGKKKIHRMSGTILESFRRNYFIFSNFVLRNILRFPSSFQPERRVSDVVVTVDLQTITDDLMNVLESEDYYRAEIEGVRESIEVERYREEWYRSLLECSESVDGLARRITEVCLELENVTRLYSQMSMVSCIGDEDYNTFLEYREVKSSLARNERDELLGVASEEVLSMMNKCVEK
ncbi:uncharacterized protein Eint_070560 [Encephalitozoon intestinalis ATCC 50506]|uniref:Uncharacterized protein n=1 Tax=Encephalitozoon intestinalis (strain ATCC 50506) TaxID=876142 RepID=E0S7Y5_ENCIT|nr:uncharacterized protein Eint_070560 [Encephalitozoon intestinalis ATCC 50506]ADM11820.1 hypothetical protein Eint_070560 [Encephalitozoon intestinalis ATCC 50506]UTX45570.1 hypothetical protein GPK93_07g11330 [Encephalitozoon intestinalis]